MLCLRMAEISSNYLERKKMQDGRECNQITKQTQTKKRIFINQHKDTLFLSAHNEF